MFNGTIKNVSGSKRVLNLAITGLIVSSEYWNDETGYDLVTQMINDFNPAEGDEIKVSINSQGGDYFAGVAIYNTLKACSAKVITQNMGLAASAACVIFMAGDERVVYPGTTTMTHDPLTGTYGNADYLRDVADKLDSICESAKGVFIAAGIDSDKLVELMKDETNMTPQQAVEFGFATKYDDSLTVQNCAVTDEMKGEAVKNSFGNRPEKPAKDPVVENKASAEIVINSCSENGLGNMIAIFNAKGFTERELNATISSVKDIQGVCAASGVNFDNLKDKVLNSADLLRAFASERLADDDHEIETNGVSNVESFVIKPINGCQ